MIAEARRRASVVAAPVAYHDGDAHHLAFPDSAFDLVRTERVLRYLEDPDAAIREMTRVTRAGGSVIAFDFDSDSTVVDAPDRTLTRRIADVLDAAVPHPWIGRQLLGLFHRVGLVDVRVVPCVTFVSGSDGLAVYQQLTRGTIARGVERGRLASADAETWWSGLQAMADADSFFTANLGFIVAGRRSLPAHRLVTPGER
jgi:ubiquinone/menaquinone biosynthesis C-methylase UbiE